jgi:ParB family transcriptional regulator, chromosome partitioning protein
MPVKKRGLGRGLSDIGLNELLSRMTTDIKPVQVAEKQPEEEAVKLKQLPVDSIEPGKYQPRRELKEQSLQELAESIRSQGIIQPIVVRALPDDRYEIIAGERRWRAAKLANLTEIPVIIRQIPDEAALAIALIENIQREDLNAIEEAIALQRLITEFSLTHQQVAAIVGKSRASISNLLRLLSLPEEVKQMVDKGDLEMGHARALLSLDERQRIQTAQKIISKQLSVRETELYIKCLLNFSAPPEPKTKDLTLSQMEKTLSKQLGVRVAIKPKDDHKGKVIVYYRKSEQLQAILSHFNDGKELG